MQHYLVEVWAGEADHRWNIQTVGVMARSKGEATQIVAQDLGLHSGCWEGDNPPFELAAQSLGETPTAEEPLTHRAGGRNLLAAVGERWKRLFGIPLGTAGREIRSSGARI